MFKVLLVYLYSLIMYFLNIKKGKSISRGKTFWLRMKFENEAV